MTEEERMQKIEGVASKPFNDRTVEAFEKSIAECQNTDPETYAGSTVAYDKCVEALKTISKDAAGAVVITLLHKFITPKDLISIIKNEEGFVYNYLLKEMVKDTEK